MKKTQRKKSPIKTETRDQPTRRSRRAWVEAYAARRAEINDMDEAPNTVSMSGMGYSVIAGTRRKVFVVETKLSFGRRKPVTTIISMSDGR